MATRAEDLIRRHRYTVEEFLRMGEAGILRADERVELIEGEIAEMAPIGSRHAGTVKQIGAILMRTVGEGAIVSVQDPIILGPRSAPQPDLALLRPRADFYKAARLVAFLASLDDMETGEEPRKRVPHLQRLGA